MIPSHVARWSALALAAAILVAASCSPGATTCDGGYQQCGAVCCLECDKVDPTTCNDDSNAGSTSGTSSSNSDAGHCQSSFETPCDGECVRLSSDVNNCGACGNVCKPDLAGRPARCFASECQ